MSDQNKDEMVSQEPQETEDPAQADYNKGKDLLSAGDEAQAASYFHNALIAFDQADNEQGIARASDQLGDLCTLREEHEKAVAHYQRAYEICKKEKDMFSLIALLKKMATSNKALKQLDEVVRNYLNIIDIYGGYNNPAGTVAAMEELADLYLEMGERQKSADTYRTIGSIHKNFSHNHQARKFMDKAAQVEQSAE